MKNLTKLLFLLALAFGLSTVAMADTIWNVSASLAYNSSTNVVSGSFQLDPSLNLVTWTVVVNGTNTQANNAFTPANSIAIYPDTTHLAFYDGVSGQYVDFYLASPLSNAGGTIPLLYGDGGASSNSTIACPGCSTLVSGFVTTNAIPEPGSMALLGSGFLGVAAVLRRKLLL